MTIPRFLAGMIGEHIGRYSAGYLFTAAQGGPVRHRNFRPGVAATDAVADELRFHDLRHTCAALLIANGRRLDEVKDSQLPMVPYVGVPARS